MDKFRHILYFTFVLMPLFYWCGLSIIVIDNMYIGNCQFSCKKFRRKKQQIDKNKFAELMKRITK